MPDDSFLDIAAERAYKEMERLGGDPAKLPAPLQTVAVLYAVQAIIDSGGFRHLFENDLPCTPPYSIITDSYRRIGAIEAATNLDGALSMFPFDSPHLDKEARNDFMDGLEDGDQFFQLGERVRGDEGIWIALEEYVRKHGEAFRVM